MLLPSSQPSAVVRMPSPQVCTTSVYATSSKSLAFLVRAASSASAPSARSASSKSASSNGVAPSEASRETSALSRRRFSPVVRTSNAGG